MVAAAPADFAPLAELVLGHAAQLKTLTAATLNQGKITDQQGELIAALMTRLVRLEQEIATLRALIPEPVRH